MKLIRTNPFRLTALLFVALVLVATGCKKSKVDAFPASNVVSGWEKTSETRTFAAKDLWQYIDGDAEHYLAAGVVSTATSEYKYQGKLEAVVDVHTMKAADGASKLLTNDKAADAKALQVGDEAVGYAQSVVFRKGIYLVRIVSFDATPDGQQAMLALAQGIAAKL